MLEIIQKNLADLAASNWDDYKATFSNDVVYEEIATHVRVQGADDYLEAIQRWKRAFPDLKGTITSSVTSGDQAIIEVVWEGTHQGPLEGPFGTVPPTSLKGRLEAVLVLKFAGGKIAASRHYFDLLTLLSQLGMVPAVGAAPPEARAPAAPKHA